MSIAIVGTGLIGQAWAIVFARGGQDVTLWDAQPGVAARSLDTIAKQLRQLEAYGLVDSASEIHGRVRAVRELRDALADATYVQESLPEDRSIKREIFSSLDRMTPATAVLASSTSSIPASAFTEELAGRHRCLVAHPVNPPYLVPVVELCGAPWTARESIVQARDLLTDVGQKPVVIHRELNGFVLNRLQGALLREAVRLVEQGYVDVEGVDLTVREGLGLRWAFMGPFETIDLNAPGGLSDYCERYGDMYQSFVTDLPKEGAWSEDLVADLERARRKLLPATKLDERRVWRDQRLMRLAAQKLGADAAF